MGMESENFSFETPERSALFSERLTYENQLQAGLNKENSIRSRYGADLKNDSEGQREILEAQREQQMAQRMIDNVDERLRNTKMK